MVTAHSKAAKGSGRKASHMTIRPVHTGGFVSSTMHERPTMGSKSRGMAMPYMDDSEEAIHPDAASLAAHVMDKFGGHPPMPPSDASDDVADPPA